MSAVASNRDDVLHRWYAAMTTGAVADLRAVVTEDIIATWNGDPALIPWAGRHSGIEVVGSLFATLSHNVEVVSLTPVDKIAAADAVVVIVEGKWRVRDTDTIISARACNVFRFRGDRVASYEVFNDTAPFAAALAGAGR